MISRVLIANRGEIALRIIRACREMGIETVAVYSEADRESPYLQLADEAICIGPADPAQSYRSIPSLISAAEIADVDAIHRGYGFLAENEEFAQICQDCGITFIGPSPQAMHLLGDKVQARALAIQAQVPVVPGSEGTIQDEVEAIKLANKIGYPVIVKAAAGGGGEACGPRTMTSACEPPLGLPVQRPRRPSATAACIWRSTSWSRVTSRSRWSPMPRAMPSISTSGTAPSNDGTRR